MARATNWAIGIGLVLAEVGLVVVGWQWYAASQGKPVVASVSMPKGAPTPTAVWGARVVGPAEAKDLHCEGAVFLDVQAKGNNDANAVPGSEWVDYRGGFGNRQLARYAGPDDKIVVYCENHRCWDAYKLVKDLVGWGMPKVYYLRGGIVAWDKDLSSLKNKFKRKRCGPGTLPPIEADGGPSPGGGGITDKMRYFNQ